MVWILFAATLVVNVTGDGHDASPGDGVCDAGSGCTFRAAVEEASALTGPDTITLGPGITRVFLDPALGTVASSDTLSIHASSDTLDCGGLSGATCLHLGAPATLTGLVILNGDFPLFVQNARVNLDQVRLQASHTALQAEGASVNVLQSFLSGQQSAIRADSASLVIRRSRMESMASTVLVWRNLRLTPIPLDTLDQDTLVSSSTTCLHVEGELQRGVVSNSVMSCGGYGLYLISSGFSPESLTLVADSFHILGSNTAIYGNGGRAFRFENLRFTTSSGAGSGGGFMILENARRVHILNSLVQDAGKGNMIELHNVDSSRIEGNRFLFSSIAYGVGGVVMSGGSEADTLRNNRYARMEWAGIAVFDSSSNILVYGDSLDQTGGIVLRPHWTGRYWTPFYVSPGNLPPRVGSNIRIRKAFIRGETPLQIVGLDSVFVDSSRVEMTSSWGIGAFVAGSQAFFHADTFLASGTGAGTGHAISVEWFYGDSDDATTASDDAPGWVTVDHTHVEQFFSAFRFVDIDTSMIKVDTLWNGNNNTSANLTRMSDRFFLTLVQVFNNACSLLPGVDSVRLSSSFYNQVLSKRNDVEGLFAYHYEPTPTTHYDSLELWTLTPVEIWDGNNPPQWVSDYTVTLYEGTVSDDDTVSLTYGLANMLDPCPSAGHPKSVANRWMVMKIKSSYATEVKELPTVAPPVWRYTLAPGRLILESRGIPLRVVDPAGRVRLQMNRGTFTLFGKGVFWILGPGERKKVMIP